MTRCIGCDGIAFGEIELDVSVTGLGDCDETRAVIDLGVCQMCADRLKNGERLLASVTEEDHL